jgi:hypothetical protein
MLNGKERAHLRERSDMTDTDHAAWTRIQGAEDGAIALTIMAGGDRT